ncbi:hypothetical protein HF086_009563 [Spodoptera exigua]|uniref:EGF-like domain-containing protein n=1 Tax=Spodoptera exigua TaxID=7107 RepID=A0A922M6S8_SPOEX|nr:hypothetical protein HF086_009563 [Spodoptera exigua]
MFLLRYICVTFMLYVNLTQHFCLCEPEEALDDILNPPSSTTFPKSEEQTQESTFLVFDDQWLVNALQDVAYFLRNHKFNEWDRRYSREKPKDTLQVGFYHAFPEPSLKAVHWKVYGNCYKDFYECVKYLSSVIETAPFTRNDDITTTLKKKKNLDEISISKLNDSCKQALLYAEKTGLPFDAPEEKFQWRTSASYYMCWYTMKGIPALSMLGETCDNFANCLDSTFGYRNHDPRSDDKFSFACAMYSFCPDPCCPLKHVKSVSDCYENEQNPCFIENAYSTDKQLRTCRFDRKDNQNLDDIIENRWNVSCNCKEKGFVWKSQFGMCVDINECATGKHNCNRLSENCINLPGTFKCICRWGYAYDKDKKICIKHNVLSNYYSKTDIDMSFLDILITYLEYIGFW